MKEIPIYLFLVPVVIGLILLAEHLYYRVTKRPLPKEQSEEDRAYDWWATK